MDILVTATNEVAAVDAGQIITQGSGFKLSDGTMYPPGLMLVQNVAIPEELIGKRLSYTAGVFAELPAYQIPIQVPQSVEPLKAIYLLDQMGLGAAYKAYRESPDRTLLEQETLLRAKVWERNNPVLIAAASAMGITSEQLDQMFIQIGY